MQDSDHDGITRRDFINGVLITGAALTMASAAGLTPLSAATAPTAQPAANPGIPGLDKTTDFVHCHGIWRNDYQAIPAGSGKLYDCIIVGGGISGLTAAWKLNKLGIDNFLLIEKDQKPGGLCSAETINGITGAKASAYPSLPFDEDMLELYKELDFVTQESQIGKIRTNPKYVLKPPYDQVFIGDSWVTDAFEEEGIMMLPISRQAKEDLEEFIEELDDLYEWRDKEERAAFDCPIDNSSPDSKMRGLDKMTLGEYVTSQGWSLEMIKIFDPLLRSAYGLGHDRISAWAALDILMDELLEADPGESSIGFPGGNAFFADKIAATIEDKQLRTDSLVTRIVEKNKEVLVTVITKGQAETLRAKTVIFAAAQFTTPYLLPELSAERKKAAQAFEYASYVVASIEVSRTLPNLAYSNQLVGDFVLSDFIVADWTKHADPQNAPLSRKNILTAYCPMNASDRKMMLTPSLKDWENRILAEFEQCLPGISKTVTGFHLYRWGHAFAVPSKGWLFSKERMISKKPFGRISFAGADVEGIPTIDHAMTAAFRAAREIEEQLD